MDESLVRYELLKCEDPNKMRSRMYGFSAKYYLNERRFYGNPNAGFEKEATIEVTCTDEGIRNFRGIFLKVVDKQAVDHGKLIDIETIKRRDEIISRQDLGKSELCYYAVDVDDGDIVVHPAWVIYAIQEHDGEPYIAYAIDALNGEFIYSDMVWR